jgi:ComF family protein
MLKIQQSVINFIFPSTCIFCNAPSKRKLDLCVACENELSVLKNYCTCCAQPLPEGQTTCGNCLNNRLTFIRTFVLFHYQMPVDQLILGLKFNNRLVNAKILGELLADYLCDQYQTQNKPEIIIPVPLHASRLYERGYNQALELARPIARKLKIRIDKSNVERTKNTLAQALLPAKKRQQNIKHAFGVTKAKHYKHVAVIDDVITTGNTVMELCEMLHRAGVEKIDVWCCAKAHF